MSMLAFSRMTSRTSVISPTSLYPVKIHIRRSISTIRPGDIYSKIFSEFQNSVLVPQHDGQRKNIVLKRDAKQVQFTPLNYSGDATSLFSHVIIPDNDETGLKFPHAVIAQHVFAISVEQFVKGEKHGSAPTCLDAIQKAQEKVRVFFWSSTMNYRDYYKQLDEIIRAHPEYHLA